MPERDILVGVEAFAVRPAVALESSIIPRTNSAAWRSPDDSGNPHTY